MRAIPSNATMLGTGYYTQPRSVYGTPYTLHRIHRIDGTYIGAQISPPTLDDAHLADAKARAEANEAGPIARTVPQLPRRARGHA